MGQQLRITFEQKDYCFQLSNIQPIDKETVEIQIIFDGNTQILVRDKQNWIPKEENENLQLKLAMAIGRAISLRYRI